MNPEKIGKFIKEIRTKNNLTQEQLAKKYGVTYQAVSKWENGKNLPDVILLRQMSKDFNISVEDLLDGEKSIKKIDKKKIIIISLLVIIIISASFLLFELLFSNDSFNSKILSSQCSDFKVSGSLAYDKNKSAINIFNINYCGEKDNNIYDEIECNLYENYNNNNIKISSCEKQNNITLDNYLNNVKLYIDNYEQTCKNYSNNSLYLEINANKNNEVITYKVPLSLDSCN